jgi:hypothetical protein
MRKLPVSLSFILGLKLDTKQFPFSNEQGTGLLH